MVYLYLGNQNQIKSVIVSGQMGTGLAIYVAVGLRSGTAEIIAVAFTACMRKLDIFQVASNVSLVAEIGVRKKSARVQCRKLC